MVCGLSNGKAYPPKDCISESLTQGHPALLSAGSLKPTEASKESSLLLDVRRLFEFSNVGHPLGLFQVY